MASLHGSALPFCAHKVKSVAEETICCYCLQKVAIGWLIVGRVVKERMNSTETLLIACIWAERTLLVLIEALDADSGLANQVVPFMSIQPFLSPSLPHS